MISNGKILVVDDDVALLRLFAMAMEREGFEVATATTGREGLHQSLATAFDVVLLDIHLPDLSGIEVMRQIVQSSKAAVILITGDDIQYTPEIAIEEGAADFIVKPIRLSELTRRVHLARQSRARAEAQESQIANLTILAIRDELTGLYNRRYFHEQLPKEMERACRYQHHLSLCLFDIDHFKEINDTRGHLAGDKVLRGVGRLLNSIIRRCDLPVRYGGDEFVILAPETSDAQALAMMEKIREAVVGSNFLPDFPVTISGGVVEYQPGGTADSLLQRADEALYEAKRNGRNCMYLA